MPAGVYAAVPNRDEGSSLTYVSSDVVSTFTFKIPTRMSVLSAAHGGAHTVFSNFFVSLPVPKASVDLSQQIFIVTGSNTGLGLETSRHLLRLGAGKLIVAVRNLTKGEAAKQELLSSTERASDSVEVWSLDMDSYDSVKAFGRRASSLSRLDGVLANAGLATTTYSLSEGNEKTLNVNMISTFLLFFVLLPKLRDSERQTGNACRFVIPNSALHYVASTAQLDPKQDMFARLNDESKADMFGRYPLSKLLVIWIVRELGDRYQGSPIINTPNPSFCQSDLMREHDTVAVRMMTKVFARTTEQGSRVLYHGLFAGKESNGQYLTNCHVQRPAQFVNSRTGLQIQKALFEQLMKKLELIDPSIPAMLSKA